MTNEEAIRIIKIVIAIAEDFEIIVQGEEFTKEKCKEAVEIASKALEQKPCEDCISRQAVLDGLASIAKAKAKSDAQKALMGRVMFFTEHLPSVTPQTNTGEYENTMREATPEELESVNNYIKSISKPTGVNIWDKIEEVTTDADSD